MFRQCSQAKYLTATTTRRSYYHLTGQEVENLSPEEFIVARAVKPLEGDPILFFVTKACFKKNIF